MTKDQIQKAVRDLKLLNEATPDDICEKLGHSWLVEKKAEVKNAINGTELWNGCFSVYTPDGSDFFEVEVPFRRIVLNTIEAATHSETPNDYATALEALADACKKGANRIRSWKQ